MKKTKLLVLGTSILLLAACGGTSSSGSSNPTTQPTEPSKEITYQFVGEYTDSTLSSMGFDYFVILNLYDDGTLEGSGYNCMSMNSSPAAENAGFYADWINGTWEEGLDEEDQECIVINTEYGEDATNMMTGGTPLEGEFTYYVYPDTDNSMSFTLDVPVFSGRQCEVNYNGTIIYDTMDEFIKGTVYSYREPENTLVTFEDSTNHFKLYVLDDNTIDLANGTLDPADNTYRYKSAKKGTWAYETNELSFIFNGDETKCVATIEGNKATLNYTYVLYAGYGETALTLVCDDVTSLLQ